MDFSIINRHSLKLKSFYLQWRNERLALGNNFQFVSLLCSSLNLVKISCYFQTEETIDFK